jgi:hypothetical protein
VIKKEERSIEIFKLMKGSHSYVQNRMQELSIAHRLKEPECLIVILHTFTLWEAVDHKITSRASALRAGTFDGQWSP